MADLLGAVDALFGLAGPFLIPVAIFVVGVVGYAALLALGRASSVRPENGRRGRGRRRTTKRVEGELVAGTRRRRRDRLRGPNTHGRGGCSPTATYPALTPPTTPAAA